MNELLKPIAFDARTAAYILPKKILLKTDGTEKADRLLTDIVTQSSIGIGELTVLFRTQSEALIRAMTEFFRLWKQRSCRARHGHFAAVEQRYRVRADGLSVCLSGIDRTRELYKAACRAGGGAVSRHPVSRAVFRRRRTA